MEEDVYETPKILQCSMCNEVMETHQIFCISCGYPEKGSHEEQSKFHANSVLNTHRSDEAKRGITGARNVLFIISGLNMLWGIFYFFQNEQEVSLLIYFTIISVIYVILGYWSQQKPLIALILGLLVYLTIIVLAAIADTSTIYSELLIKALVVGYLARGINAALQIKKA